MARDEAPPHGAARSRAPLGSTGRLTTLEAPCPSPHRSTRSAPRSCVMDYQPAIVAIAGDDADALVARAAAAIGRARGAGVHVGYVRVALTAEDRAAIPERNRAFSQVAASGRLADGDPDADVHPDLRPAEGDVVVTKTRTGAFSTTDLARRLAALGVDTLVLAGISTSGVVLSTVRRRRRPRLPPAGAGGLLRRPGRRGPPRADGEGAAAPGRGDRPRGLRAAAGRLAPGARGRQPLEQGGRGGQGAALGRGQLVLDGGGEPGVARGQDPLDQAPAGSGGLDQAGAAVVRVGPARARGRARPAPRRSRSSTGAARARRPPARRSRSGPPR